MRFIGLCSCTRICYLHDWHLFIMMHSLKILQNFWPLEPSSMQWPDMWGSVTERDKIFFFMRHSTADNAFRRSVAFLRPHLRFVNRSSNAHTFSDSQETYFHVILQPYIKGKGKAIPVTGCGGPLGSETSRFPHFLHNRFTNGSEVVNLTRLPPFTSRKIPGTNFC
jgi:hypothetical protein